jgi:hypothetical protein
MVAVVFEEERGAQKQDEPYFPAVRALINRKSELHRHDPGSINRKSELRRHDPGSMKWRQGHFCPQEGLY